MAPSSVYYQVNMGTHKVTEGYYYSKDVFTFITPSCPLQNSFSFSLSHILFVPRSFFNCLFTSIYFFSSFHHRLLHSNYIPPPHLISNTLSFSPTYPGLHSLYTTSPCIGVVVHYIPLQLNLWWVSHMVTLLWKMRHPLQAKMPNTRKYHRVIHIVCVVIGLLAPLISVVAIIAENSIHDRNTSQDLPGSLGFGFGIFPPVLCAGLNGKVTFYTLIFPNILLVMVGTSTLAITIWTIHKVHYV